MRLFVAVGILAALACAATADNVGSIPLNAKIYVDSATGFDSELAAAIRDHKVPVNITTQKDGADYEFQALSGASVIPPAEFASEWLHGYGEAGFRILNLHNGNMVFVARFDRNMSMHDWKDAAETCASSLRTGVNRSDSHLHSADSTLDFSH